MNIAFLSTYPPRECGIATFTQDLVTYLSKIELMSHSKIIAVSNGSYRYDNKVIMELMQNDVKSYKETANKLNNTDIALLVIEHEYGIYGGECGENLLELTNNLKIPFVTTLHTVLPEPTDKQRHILNILGQKGKKIITMANNTVDILKDVYGIDESKIEVINHGVPYMPMKSRESLKTENGFDGRTVVSTFGLLGPGKGLEYGVEAIAKVAKAHKDVLYLILGQTHPAIKKESGEAYRKSLEDKVSQLGIEDNVRFVNKYLTKEEIIKYLKLSDIYMTPYLGKDQAVSGTLAYAVGYGRVIVSTPYSYAKEMLSEDRGLLAEFRDSDSIARCINYVLDNPEKKEQMEQKTSETGKTMMWDHVAEQYKNLFCNVVKQYGKIPVITLKKSSKSLILKSDHIFHMTDDTGMLQHSVFGVPNLTHGYTSDDNARALIMAVGMYDQYHVKKFEKLIYKYVSFLCYAQNPSGTFRNFMGYNREFLEKEGSEDCFGRCLWALCYVFANPVTPQNVKQTIWQMIEKALPNCQELISPRAKAYAIIGLGYIDGEDSKDNISKLSAILAQQYSQAKTSNWLWFEDSMTYCNAILPWAMLIAGKVTKRIQFQQIGFESLQFLESKTFHKGYFKPIGCNGWLEKGKEPAAFDEQPVEACESTLAFLKAYEISENKMFLDRAKTCFSWYYGNNSKNLSLIDKETGGIYDGIESDRLNQNQGAESLVSFWMAYLAINKFVK
jgi:glycosyltransferase involved in cell wall biosynthesis